MDRMEADDDRKVAVLVAGPEASGTRLVTRLFLECGLEGSDRHVQPADSTGWPDPSLLEIGAVWRRSIPHRKSVPKLKELARSAQAMGYTNHLVVVQRDWYATARAQVDKHRPTTMEEAFESIQAAYSHLLHTIPFCRTTAINYESLVKRPRKVMAWVCKRLEIPDPADYPTIQDANEKRYG